MGPRRKGGKKVKQLLVYKNDPTIDSPSLCAPTYHWGGLLSAKAEKAKKLYRAIRTNVGKNSDGKNSDGKNSDGKNKNKIPSGELDLQFLVYWIKHNAWDFTLRVNLL